MIVPILVAVAALLVTYAVQQIRYKRLKQLAHFPQLPPSAIWGHLAVLDEYIKKVQPKAHPDIALMAMHKDAGSPPVMMVDLRPVSPALVLVGSYEVAEQITHPSKNMPYSAPKNPHIWSHLAHLVGKNSIAAVRGEIWKPLRKRFNPGFAPQHLMTLLPVIADKSLIYLDHLDRLASSGEEFSLLDLSTKLTFDIIGRVALDQDMDAQTDNPTELMQIIQTLIRTYSDEQMQLPWWAAPRLYWKRHGLSKRSRSLLRPIIHQQHAQLQKASTKSRSILAMSLHDTPTLTSELVELICDQLCSFMFAGHDTTSIAISWAIYELSRTPHALEAIRTELDELFGPDAAPAAMRDRLSGPGGAELVNRMTYTSAVIKESLRLWPPAATGRMANPGEGLSVRLPGQAAGEDELNLEGCIIYAVPSIIHHDKAVYGDTAKAFVPERWLDPEVSGKIPAGAYRPFERGPRNCIGQELALIEARVVLALAVRRYDFTKIGRGASSKGADGRPEMGAHGQYKVDEEMYPIMQVTSKPVDGMMMKVSRVA